MIDWKRIAHHYRRLLRAEVAVSKRISLAGIAVTRNLLAARERVETLEATLKKFKEENPPMVYVSKSFIYAYRIPEDLSCERGPQTVTTT